MRVYGIDFTSAPSARKPIVCALCRLHDARLTLDALCEFESLECFANLLSSEGPWVAGMNFPFGLPRDVVLPLNWAPDWQGYVAAAAAMPRDAFRGLARTVVCERKAGLGCSPREVDRLADERSPLHVTRPPVGLMFHAGAPRLLASGATIVPVCGGDPRRTVVEAYPRLVAAALIGPRPYKDGCDPERAGACARARSELVAALGSEALQEHYGLRVEGVHAYASELNADDGADRVDAIMCAVQAAWAWERRDHGFGMPEHADPVEGWIADPSTACA